MASFVLVHGAFYGGWCWQRVADRLRAAGHRVLTPTLTGCGDRFHLLTREVGLSTHLEDLVQTLEHEDVREAIVVGHSYGGTVITAAAARAPGRVKKLVYFDAQAPADGQTASGASGQSTAAQLSSMAGGDGWLLQPLPLAAFGVVDPADVRWVEPRRHPHPMRTLLEPVSVPKGALDGIARSYVRCTQRAALVALFGADPLASFVDRARAEGWPIFEVDAPHDAIVTAPMKAADLLLAHG